jgi:hypothetical protein
VILPRNFAPPSAKAAKACVEKTQDKISVERNNFFITSSFFNVWKKYFSGEAFFVF